MKKYHALRIPDGGTWVEWLDDDRPNRDILYQEWDVNGCDFPEVACWVSQQAFYLAMRLDGVGHRLAEMLALQRPPQSNTDREFLMGRCNGSQFEGREREGDLYRSVAEAHGQDVSGKVYLGGLARFPGDPEAWVSGKGDVERVLDRRGWGCDGLVKREARGEGPPPQGPAVAPHLVEDEVDLICEDLGVDGADVDRVDLAEQVFNARKGPSGQKFEPAVHCPSYAGEAG